MYSYKIAAASLVSYFLCNEFAFASGDGWGKALGQGDDTTKRISPVPVLGEHKFEKIFASGHGSSAFGIKADGTTWSWGSGYKGVLGVGDTANKGYPTQISGHSFVKIVLGECVAFGLKANGELWGWGGTDYGQLPYSSNVPIQIPCPSGHWIDISTSNWSTIALTNNGKAYFWGGNESGQRGIGSWDGNYTNELFPWGHSHTFVRVFASEENAYGLKENGELWGAGRNRNLGNGISSPTDSFSIIRCSNLLFKHLSVGVNYVLAIDTSDRCLAWGTNREGHLGVGDFTDKNTPTLTVEQGFSELSAGNENSMGLKPDGSIWAWGDNWNGALGIGVGDNGRTSVPILVPFECVAITPEPVPPGKIINKLKVNCKQFIDFDLNNSVKIYNTEASYLYAVDIFLETNNSSSLIWILRPNTDGSSKISFKIDNSDSFIYNIKKGSIGESFSNPISYNRPSNFGKTIVRLPTHNMAFQDNVSMISGNNGDFLDLKLIVSEGTDMTLLNKHIQDITIVVTPSTLKVLEEEYFYYDIEPTGPNPKHINVRYK